MKNRDSAMAIHDVIVRPLQRHFSMTNTHNEMKMTTQAMTWTTAPPPVVSRLSSCATSAMSPMRTVAPTTGGAAIHHYLFVELIGCRFSFICSYVRVVRCPELYRATAEHQQLS